eukprot:2851860-Alexandrium_andersonii.AAC.1
MLATSLCSPSLKPTLERKRPALSRIPPSQHQHICPSALHDQLSKRLRERHARHALALANKIAYLITLATSEDMRRRDAQAGEEDGTTP